MEIGLETSQIRKSYEGQNKSSSISADAQTSSQSSISRSRNLAGQLRANRSSSQAADKFQAHTDKSPKLSTEERNAEIEEFYKLGGGKGKLF